jgi:hypothetical protein
VDSVVSFEQVCCFSSINKNYRQIYAHFQQVIFKYEKENAKSSNKPTEGEKNPNP